MDLCSTHLEGFVCVEVKGHSGVRKEEVQPAKVEQVVSAHLPGKRLHGPWILYRVQKHDLQLTQDLSLYTAASLVSNTHKSMMGRQDFGHTQPELAL